jgi:serine-type D-Ala-D-Ala carboxypeptidase (penicillin-binding protein 5/6)
MCRFHKLTIKKFAMFKVLLGLLVSASVWGAPQPAQIVTPPPAPTIAAKSFMLLDFNSGQVLLEKDPDVAVEPASLTKLMTAYVVFSEIKAGRLKLTDKVRVSEKAWRTGGSRMFIDLDTEVSVEDLLRGMIIQSGNDASVALAERIAGSEDSFAGMMNQYAHKLGLTKSHFLNATGMDSTQHISSARDMAKIAMAIIRDFPEYYGYYSEKSFTYKGIAQANRNILLKRDPSVDGMKTGFTEKAKYCLVASAKRNEMRLISVILGAETPKTRAAETQKMLNYGFQFYETQKVYGAGEAINKPRVWKGAEDFVPIGLNQDIYVTVARGQYSKIKPVLQLNQRLIAPVKSGETCGTLRLMFDDKMLLERPLVALQTVNEGGLVRLITDSILLWIQ